MKDVCSLRGVFLLVACAGLVSCTGELDGTGDKPGPMPLRRLTSEEYNYTVRDLVGDRSNPGNEFVGESFGDSGFATPGIVSTVDVGRYMDAAEHVAAHATKSLETLLPCDPSKVGEDACADAFVRSFGQRAFRRPLELHEVAGLLGLYSTMRKDAGYGFGDGIRVVIQGILQAPQFLYHWELGAVASSSNGTRVRLTPYQVASRLSYFLWSSMPDDELIASAGSGKLDTGEGIAREARRLLRDPRARDTVASFRTQWLGLSNLSRITKDPAAYPDFEGDLRAAMGEETKAFFDYVVLYGDGRFDTLLTAPFSFVNEPLAKLYGVEGVTGQALRKVSLDPTQRSGILTQPALLSVTANAYEGSLVHRGQLVRERFLCQTLAPPPANIPALPKAAPGVSLRKRSEMHTMDGACRSCHLNMDPIGYGFGNFDAIGRYIAEDGGQPVDTSGFIKNIDGTQKTYNGVKELTTILAQSPEVRRCFEKQWFRFAFRRAEVPEESAALDAVYDAFSRSDYDIRELLVALTQVDSFSSRTLAEGEVVQ